MDRNEKRYWYDKGYSLAVSETKRDSIIPRVIGVWLILGMAWWDPVVATLIVGMWTTFEYLEYRSESRKSESKRERYEPGKRWE